MSRAAVGTRDEAVAMVRCIADLLGALWQVWEVHPPATSQPIPAALRAGWLGFQSESDRRRFAPIPDGWQAFSEDDLLLLLAQSDSVGSTQRAGA
jgi:hypothetical protein